MSVANQSFASEKQPKEYSFSSERGRSLSSRIIQQYVPHPAHDYVLEGIGKALDGKDVFAVTPTGSGKTGYMAFTALVVKVLKDKPEVYPEAKDNISREAWDGIGGVCHDPNLITPNSFPSTSPTCGNPSIDHRNSL
ncbi:hypothetical protein DFJ43DRAFT_1149139 [Lentinula guzmanii]|uniref:DEAD/DEAH box helicase domain-containing protein n=1 Tax=Lentinula guzmanii TaxID=2804957 RepID=A0AA38JS58_9AGAR|nr:hypothetical protein DFJ43DRAFT_1149139 [Lentinula guzmanii]